MNIVLLQAKLRLEDIDQLLKEFPQYLFLSISEPGCHSLGAEHWSRVEIFFGDKITREEINIAHQLRWIHTSSDDNTQLPLDLIDKLGNVIVTNTEVSNIRQIGEFVMSGILAFSKHLLKWKSIDEFPNLVWDGKWRDSMWTLSSKTLLQIGLDPIGTEVALQAKCHNMRVFGAQERRSFHPHCNKTIAFKNLHSVLPASDVVVISLPKEKESFQWFGKAELELMKKDSILIIVGNNRVVDEDALARLAKKDHFRGVIIDASPETPIAATSPLWKAPNVIITPNVAQYPLTEKEQAFQNFRYNLRQYMHGNFLDMRNVLSKPLKSLELY